MADDNFQHVEYFIEMAVLDERWVTLEEGSLTLIYANAALREYQEEFPDKTVRIVRKTTTCEVLAP